MADKKTFSKNDIVLTCILADKKKGKVKVTPHNFSFVNFKGATVSGESYYVDKAVKLGAKKA